MREPSEEEWHEAMRSGPKPGQRFHVMPVVDLLSGSDMSVLALTPALASKLRMVLERAGFVDADLMLLRESLDEALGKRASVGR